MYHIRSRSWFALFKLSTIYCGPTPLLWLLCYWAVRKLGLSATELSKKLGVSQPSVSISVKRGERIAKAEQLELVEGYKVII